MSGDRRRRYARLLRWYPASWRQEHGEIVLDSLEQHAIDRGRQHPSIPEAWSLRAHGLGERATHRWAAGLAAAALIAFIGATALLLTNAVTLPEAGPVQLLLAMFIGPLALALSAIALLHRAGRLSAPAALFTAASALPACGFAALTAASWSVAFEEADAGLGFSWFGSSTLLFLLLAWLAGTACMAAPVGSVLIPRPALPLRLLRDTVLAAPVALVLGALTLTTHMTGILGAVALLFAALRMGRSTRPVTPREPARTAVRPAPPGPPTAKIRRRYAFAGAAALASFVVGLGCAIFALTGSSWTPRVTDSTHAMNLGLAAGALAAIPVTFAAGALLTPRLGPVMRGPTLLCCASLLLEAAAQLLGAGHPTQWPLTLGAAALMGLAVALPFGRLVPGSRPLRIGVTVLLSAAGSIPGLALVTMSAFIAPLAAAALFLWAVTRMSGQRREQGLQLVECQNG